MKKPKRKDNPPGYCIYCKGWKQAGRDEVMAEAEALEKALECASLALRGKPERLYVTMRIMMDKHLSKWKKFREEVGR